ncbi:PA domain-containing protein, partial [Luteimonas panaciterrae]|uniref:PA domain-containing protein n=1 Tax=Luteimonas panaciterrae TaxID=363885 RepID=UPI00299E648B
AMDLWGALLKSDVEIRVQGSFAPLPCYMEPSGSPYIVLGQASGIGSVRGSQIPGAKFAEAWYPTALANSLAGKDLDEDEGHIQTADNSLAVVDLEGEDDIQSVFSSAIDQPECRAIGVPGWHYGLRGNADNTGGKANFLNVIMHEIGHGLGVLGYGIPGVGTPWDYSAHSNQFDKALPAIASKADMSKATTTPGDVVWTGALANPTAGLFAEHRLMLNVSAPQQASYDIVPGSFGERDPAKFPSAEIVLVLDEAAAGATATSLACDGASGRPKIANGGALRGKIALVDRGTCSTSVQAVAVQKYGAIGLISISNGPGDPVTPS